MAFLSINYISELRSCSKTVLKCKLGIRDTDILRGLFFESRKFQLKIPKCIYQDIWLRLKLFPP